MQNTIAHLVKARGLHRSGVEDAAHLAASHSNVGAQLAHRLPCFPTLECEAARQAEQRQQQQRPPVSALTNCLETHRAQIEGLANASATHAARAACAQSSLVQCEAEGRQYDRDRFENYVPPILRF